MDLLEIRNQIGRILGTRDYLTRYPNARAGLRWIVAGTIRNAGHEPDCEQFVDWLHEEGEQYGLRPFTAQERARAAGVASYCGGLGLTGRRLYDVIGLSFDGNALLRRIGAFLRDWGDPERGGCYSSNRLPGPQELFDTFHSLDPIVDRLVGARRAPAPFPPDLLRRWLPQPAVTRGNAAAVAPTVGTSAAATHARPGSSGGTGRPPPVGAGPGSSGGRAGGNNLRTDGRSTPQQEGGGSGDGPCF